MANGPSHIAIIMDGNGRWAQARQLPRTAGHQQGTETLRQILAACSDLGVQYLSVYAFSTENWKRSKTEVFFLMKLLKENLKKELPHFMASGVRVRFVGYLEGLSPDLQKAVRNVEEKTKSNTRIQLNILFNYGGREELTQAVKRLLEQGVDPQTVTEETISQSVYTAGIPDPDLLIRTGGDFRISNFLLWQLAYTELFFVPTLWPDFSKEMLADIVRQFQTRERRFGGVLNED